MLYKKHFPTIPAYLVTGAIAVGSIVAGFFLPVSISPVYWMVILTVYVFIASWVPVWVILQPRDFINVQILYAGVALLVTGLVVAGIGGAHFGRPAFSMEQVDEGQAAAGGIWPLLFVTVACGAISGFHSLVSSGTTAKQCWMAKHARPTAFGGMLLEALLAAAVIATVAWAFTGTDPVGGFGEYRRLVYGPDSNPVLAFSLSCGRLCENAFGIPVALGSVFGILLVEGFVVTTLDTAIRLNRYLLEELWLVLLGVRMPSFMKRVWFNSAVAVALMFFMASFNAADKIWPIFGSANQLLAAMALLVISMWLLARKRQAWFTLLPAAFMTVTTIAALVILFVDKYLPTGNVLLMVTDVILVLLAISMVVMAIRSLVARQWAQTEVTE